MLRINMTMNKIILPLFDETGALTPIVVDALTEGATSEHSEGEGFGRTIDITFPDNESYERYRALFDALAAEEE